MKKLVSVLGALCMLCTAVQTLPASVQQTAMLSASASDKVSGNLTYVEYSDHTEITGLADDTAETAVIPAEINGLPVTAIANYSFVQNTFLKSIVFPDTLTEIGESAFYECTALESVSFPENLKKIGNFAFGECINLAEVNFNGSSPEIAAQAFKNTAWAESKEANASKGTFENLTYQIYKNQIQIIGTTEKIQGELVIPSEINGLPVTSIESDALSLNPDMTSVVLPDTLTTIKECAFMSCTSLSSITIPASVTSLEHMAFYYCTALKSITFEGDVSGFDMSAFSQTEWKATPEGDNNLLIVNGVLLKGTGASGEVVIPDGVTRIADKAFEENELITSVVIPNTVTSIGQETFSWCRALETVVIPDSVVSIGDQAFLSCDALKNLTMPDNIPNMGNNVFQWCTSLPAESIVIPEGTTEIEDGQYSEYYTLKSVTIPDSVTRIGETAFRGTALTSVEIPDSVTCIGACAFERTKLTSVKIPDSVTFLGSAAFHLAKELKTAEISASVTEIQDNPFSNCFSLTNIEVDENNPAYCSVDGALYTKDMTKLICCPAGLTGDFVVPDGVVEIGKGAFWGCETLTSVTLPDSVRKINRDAFADCYQLASVNIPDGVSEIEPCTFSYCTALKSITIPASVEKIKTQAFVDCWGLNDVTILNPDCYIYPSCTTIHDGSYQFQGIIRGYDNSTAQQYVEEYGKKFESLGSRDGRGTSDITSPEQTSLNLSAGDADGSGEIDILDIITINKAILGKETLTSSQLQAIDFNGNGKPDSEEALTLMKYIVGLIKTLPTQETTEEATEPAGETSAPDGFELELRTFEGDDAVYEYITATPAETAPTAFETHFTPEWLPEGYKLEGTSITEKGDMFSKTYHYTEKNYSFQFSQNLYSNFSTCYTQSQTLPMRMTRFSTTINGNPAFYYVLSEGSSETPTGYLLYWKQDGYVLNLETYTLTFEETVKIAESVVKSAD